MTSHRLVDPVAYAWLALHRKPLPAVISLFDSRVTQMLAYQAYKRRPRG